MANIRVAPPVWRGLLSWSCRQQVTSTGPRQKPSSAIAAMRHDGQRLLKSADGSCVAMRTFSLISHKLSATPLFTVGHGAADHSKTRQILSRSESQRRYCQRLKLGRSTVRSRPRPPHLLRKNRDDGCLLLRMQTYLLSFEHVSNYALSKSASH